MVEEYLKREGLINSLLRNAIEYEGDSMKGPRWDLFRSVQECYKAKDKDSKLRCPRCLANLTENRFYPDKTGYCPCCDYDFTWTHRAQKIEFSGTLNSYEFK